MSCCCPIGRPPAKPPPTSARVVSVKKEERGSASLMKPKYQDTGAPPPLATKASSVKRISATQGRRVAVRVEDDGEDAAAPFPVVQKSAEIRFQILAAINRSELLQDLSREQSDLLVNAAIEVACEAEQTVIEQGAPGDHFYMVQSGSYDVYVRASDDATQGAALKRYFSGEAFGELALTFSVDWWCIGILAYECLGCQTPFLSDSDMAMYRKIVKGPADGNISWPKSIPPDARDFIEAQINVDPLKRPGSMKDGALDVKTHKWLAQVDWKKAEARKLEAPWKPKIKSATDASNFDEFDDDAKENFPREDFAKDLFKEFADVWV